MAGAEIKKRHPTNGNSLPLIRANFVQFTVFDWERMLTTNAEEWCGDFCSEWIPTHCICIPLSRERKKEREKIPSSQISFDVNIADKTAGAREGGRQDAGMTITNICDGLKAAAKENALIRPIVCRPRNRVVVRSLIGSKRKKV